MSLGRITWLAARKISSFPTHTHARAIHILTLKSWPCRDNYIYDESYVNVHRPKILTIELSPILGTCKRNKSGKKKNEQMRDEESEDESEAELTGDTNSKVISTQVSSMRIDLIVKSGFGMARNKAEVALYESKIRINGQKVLKKSAQVQIGDVIDLIRGPSPKNPNFLLISRMTILSAVGRNEAIKIKYTRDKSLLIDNYEDEWKPLNAL